ncbi:hypothetical protein ILUMI_02916 [Ignelater luminosus]|uniref:Large ribosomal subunit protein uL16m n=1 Tax=Ignelater luminosus TaxID=2038154 RepID=A0A8K0GIU7_IGNLU|nr:hypothetical protein ILUMI_02916 [Ignelater luminosus]
MNIRTLSNLLLKTYKTPPLIQICGFKHFPAPPSYDHIKMPDRTKLTIIEKVPQYPPGLRPPKMQKRLRYMRGAETLHNFLLYKQYGIVALTGGRLKWIHFEMMRLAIGRAMDTQRMFALWRVDAPWQPVTKRGQGQRLGGGKGAIDHYVTPIKAGRVILELGGKCEYAEVQDFLHKVAMKLPFKAMAVSHQMLEKIRLKEEEDERNNVNPYTMKYVIQNNMGGCHRWLSPFDLKWFCKHT